MLKKCLTILLVAAGMQSIGQVRVLKTNLSSLFVNSPGLAYEQVRQKQFSWQVSASVHVPSKKASPFLRPVLASRTFKDAYTFGFSSTVEYRFYTKRARRDPVKPYVSFFGRYYQYESELQFFENNATYILSGDMYNFSFGLQYGTQWVIREFISIDFTFFGIGYSFNDLEGNLTTNDPSPNIGKLEDDISQVAIIGNRVRLKGNEGSYVFGEKFGTVAFRTALYVGILF